MSEAHILSAALEAGKVILLDRAAVLARAREQGISLFGFE
jgi:hypothetical protein